MKIESRTVGAVSILDLHGRLVLGMETELLKDAVQRLLAEGRLNLLINLKGVPYIDSAGIGELAASKKRVLQKGGRIEVMRVPGKYHLAVETVIELMFPGALFDDEGRALASFV